MKSLRLYKKERLCSATAIDALFDRRTKGTSAALAWPMRAVWMPDNSRRSDAPVAFLVSIPKRRLRHAVDRVTMRRRLREAYRLHHRDFDLSPVGRIDLAFIYVADRLTTYAEVERSMLRLLATIARRNAAAKAPQSDETGV